MFVVNELDRFDVFIRLKNTLHFFLGAFDIILWNEWPDFFGNLFVFLEKNPP